jgi:preprotein translocase subunit YajC
MIEGAKKGDKVITIGGIHGTVTSTEDKTVTVKVDDNCKLKLNRTAIATVVVDKPAVEDKSDKKAAPKKEKKLFAKKEPETTASDSNEVSGDEKKIEKDDKANA